MARPEKVEAVNDIARRFNGAEAALLTEYRGLRVSELAEIRAALRGADAEYKVLKNTLTRIAVREVGLDELVSMLEGPTAIAFCRGDASEAAKALDEAAKRFPVLVVKGGVLRGKVIDAEQARRLAKLENREHYLSQIAMLVNSPAQQAVNVFAALLRDLGSMLAQVVGQKEAGSPTAEEPTAESPAEEPTGESPAEEPTGESPTAESPPPGAGTDDAVTEDEPAEDAAVEGAVEESAGEAPVEPPLAEPTADDPAVEAAEEAAAGEGDVPQTRSGGSSEVEAASGGDKED